MQRELRFRDDWIMLGLVIAMAISPAVTMRWADWVPGLWVLQAISLVAVLSGFFLAKSRFSGRVALLLGVAYGLFTVGLFAGLLLPPQLPWHEKIAQLTTRLANWVLKAANVILDPDAADISRDGLIFVIQTGLILWALGFAAAWYSFRRLRIWRAILPSAVLLLVTETHYYGPQPTGVVLVAFLLSTLLYIVWSHYRVREEGWIRLRVVFHAGTRFDFLQAGLLAVLVVTPVAWVLPNLPAGGALREYTRPIDAAWQRVQDGWTQLYASLTSYGGEYADPYGNTLALGGPRRILPRAVMDVRANAGRYWRAVVYDEYTGAGWTSTAETRLIVSPDEPLRLPRYFQTQMITATFTNFMPDSGLIYFPHQPAGTDRQAKFSVFSLEDGPYDIAKTLSRYVIYEGKSYQAWGTVSTARADALRRAGTDYPYWVRERYLQLPPDMSAQVTDLAATIAAPHRTPYDQADALTNWLRTNIAYNEAAEAAPVDTDPLEYLLFESQEGYCNYYASALAVMLRSQGVPARMAAGYARGTWQAELGIYRVHSSDAHTWVEVFFPGFGWVEFEPTAAQPAILRTPPSGTESSGAGANERDRSHQEAGPDLLEGGEWGEQLPEEGGGLSWVEFLSSTPGLILAGAVVLALATGVAALLLGRQSTRGMSVVTQVYDRMSRFGRWLRVQLLPSQTPYERAALLTAAAPKATAPIDVITDLYVEERFAQDREGTFDEQAVRAWRELWPALLQESVLRYLARFQPDRTDVGRSRKVRRG